MKIIEETSIVVNVIKDLSSCKYFNRVIVIGRLDIELSRRSIKVSPKAKNKLLKKIVRTLERLGYRGSDKQTVAIIRNH